MDEEELHALAGEYVLGLLAGEDFARAEALRNGDAQFGAAVAFWELRLSALADEVAARMPPVRVWQRIQAQIAPKPARALPWGVGWRPLAAAFAGAALLAVIFIWRASQPQTHQVATLAVQGGGRFVLDETKTALIVHPSGISLPEGKVAELWYIFPGQAPKPAGVMDASHSLTTSLPASGPVTLAWSLEQPGGSPTGQPTGRIIAEGQFTTL
jgi:anti-sigma-K factor RskA